MIVAIAEGKEILDEEIFWRKKHEKDNFLRLITQLQLRHVAQIQLDIPSDAEPIFYKTGVVNSKNQMTITAETIGLRQNGHEVLIQWQTEKQRTVVLVNNNDSK